VKDFPKESQDSIIKLFIAFNEYYPESVLQHRLALFKKHLDETYFSWIGEFGDEDPYYYRIHSPVAFMELDFHCGSKCKLFCPQTVDVDHPSILDKYNAGEMSYSYRQ
jgi:hypothetical protein